MERVEDDSHVDEVRLALKALLEDTGFQRIFVDNAQADVLYTNSSQ